MRYPSLMSRRWLGFESKRGGFRSAGCSPRARAALPFTDVFVRIFAMVWDPQFPNVQNGILCAVKKYKNFRRATWRHCRDVPDRTSNADRVAPQPAQRKTGSIKTAYGTHDTPATRSGARRQPATANRPSLGGSIWPVNGVTHPCHSTH